MNKNDPNKIISDIEQKLKNFVPENVPPSLSDKLLKIGTLQPAVSKKYDIHKYFWMGMAASLAIGIIGIYFLLSQDINNIDTLAENTYTTEVTSPSIDLLEVALNSYSNQISTFNKKTKDRWIYLSNSMDNTLAKIKNPPIQKEYFQKGSNMVLAFMSARTPGVISAALVDSVSLPLNTDTQSTINH